MIAGTIMVPDAELHPVFASLSISYGAECIFLGS